MSDPGGMPDFYQYQGMIDNIAKYDYYLEAIVGSKAKFPILYQITPIYLNVASLTNKFATVSRGNCT